jgi:hypothetical protein
VVFSFKNQAWWERKTIEKKRKEISWRMQLQVLIFLIRCGKNLVIYDDLTPLSSFQYHSSIQSLILTLFDSVLGPKKILRISPANLGYILLTAEFYALTLDIQMEISWASDIKINWFKSPNSSTCLGLKLWWRSWSEIKSFYRIESSSNLVGRKGSPSLTQKLTNAENSNMTESMN